MSNIDKQALNQEKIEWLNKLADMEYCKSNPGHWLMSLKDTNMLAKLALRSVALLDELEASRNEKDELQQGFIANQEEAREAIKYATELKEQLARAFAGREEAFREVDEMQKSLDHTHRRRAIWRGRAEEAEAKLEAAEKRIAELEARQLVVKIPAYVDGRTLGYGEVNHMIDLCVDAFERACHSAGINLTVEG